jgi:hypothetical protein
MKEKDIWKTENFKGAPDDAAGYSYDMGNPMYDDEDGETRYCEDGTPWYQRKPCVRCGRSADEDGHDPCLADIPGAQFACCGHGIKEGYIKYAETPETVRIIHLSKDNMPFNSYD